MATSYATDLGELRLSRPTPLTLHHDETIAAGSLATAVTVQHVSGRVTTLGVAPGSNNAYHTVITPAEAGPITIRISGTSNTTVYTARVVAVSTWERAIGVRRKAFTAVTARRSDAVSAGTTGVLSPGGTPATVSAIIADESDAGDNKTNARKGGALSVSGPIFRVDARLANHTLCHWIQFSIVRWVSGNDYVTISKSEKIGDQANGAEVAFSFISGVNSMNLLRPLLGGRAGDYLAITIRGNTVANILLGETTAPSAGTRKQRTVASETAAPGANTAFATESAGDVLWNLTPFTISADVVGIGDSLIGGALENGDPDGSFNPVAVTADTAYLVSLGLGAEVSANKGVSGSQSTATLSGLTALLQGVPGEHAVVLISTGINDLLNSTGGVPQIVNSLFGTGPTDRALAYTAGIIDTIRGAGSIPVLLGPGPVHVNKDSSVYVAVGVDSPVTVDRLVRDLNRTLRRACQMFGVLYVDRYSVWGGRRTAANTGAQPINTSDLAFISGSAADPVHPGSTGYQSAVTEILRGLLGASSTSQDWFPWDPHQNVASVNVAPPR